LQSAQTPDAVDPAASHGVAHLPRGDVGADRLTARPRRRALVGAVTIGLVEAAARPVWQAALAQEPPAITLALDRPDVREFLDVLRARHGLDAAWLERTFADVQSQPSVVRLVTAPATAKPWREFRTGLLAPARIAAGREFMAQQTALLESAQGRWGVQPTIVAAILGVETFWGRNTGSFRVLDAITTLAFDVPARAAFFRDELAHLLLLARDGVLDVRTVRGSFAGAMGWPQFLPSSLREHAVDFDADGRIDLWGSVADVIGSVANYLAAYGWRPGEDLLLGAEVEAPWKIADLVARGALPMTDGRALWSAGVSTERPLAPRELVSLLRFEGDSGPEWRLGTHDFWVITRYNRSQNYARAVVELARAIG
jgi:membrane-bound lytic murein transglycosylase B